MVHKTFLEISELDFFALLIQLSGDLDIQSREEVIHHVTLSLKKFTDHLLILLVADPCVEIREFSQEIEKGERDH